MSAQVIFLNRWLDCPEEQKRKHKAMQIRLQEAKAKFEYETRNYTPYQKAISKMKSHNLFRNRIKIVENIIED